MTTEQATQLGKEHGQTDEIAKPQDDWTPEVKLAYLEAFSETAGMRGYALLDHAGDAQELAEKIEAGDVNAKLVDSGNIVRHGRF